jgi:CheY-like chemotaxis protein
VHPAVLRQAIIAAVGRLAKAGATRVSVFAGLEDGNVKTTLVGTLSDARQVTREELVDGMLLPDEMSIEAAIERTQAFLWIEAPSVGKTTVLIVDDNPDMARFYRRATEGTSYRVVHIARGRQLGETIAASQPNIVVLDVMLPEIDGWQLLMRLRQNPETRGIPVIVCTVVREEELALSLGASGFLTKPVRRQELISALDQAVDRIPAGGQRPAESTAAAS